MGGNTINPSYDAVCSGNTNHAEVVEIYFDDSVISFEKLLDVFWDSHDPTTINRQGNDIGTQYRSIIFYESDKQKKLSCESMKNRQSKFEKKIVFRKFFAIFVSVLRVFRQILEERGIF